MKTKLVRGVYGRIRIVEINGVRHYVKHPQGKSWVVSDAQRLTLDSMVSINGEYHFRTLHDLHLALTVQYPE